MKPKNLKEEKTKVEYGAHALTVYKTKGENLLLLIDHQTHEIHTMEDILVQQTADSIILYYSFIGDLDETDYPDGFLNFRKAFQKKKKRDRLPLSDFTLTSLKNYVDNKH
jgi:hypothetical protein